MRRDQLDGEAGAKGQIPPSSTFCSIQTLSGWMRPTCTGGSPALGRVTCVTGPPVQVLTSSSNTLTHTQKQCLIWAPVAIGSTQNYLRAPCTDHLGPVRLCGALDESPRREDSSHGIAVRTGKCSFTTQLYTPKAGKGDLSSCVQPHIKSSVPLEEREQMLGPTSSLCHERYFVLLFAVSGVDRPFVSYNL